MTRSITAEMFGIGSKIICNASAEPMIFAASELIELADENISHCKLTFRGGGEHAGGYIRVNGSYPVVVGASAVMPVKTPILFELELVVCAESSVAFEELIFEEMDGPEHLSEVCGKNEDILVIAPDYPSSSNLYLCAFVHSRNKEYQKMGLRVQVASISSSNWYEMSYEADGIPVIKGSYGVLKRLLSKRQYKVIVSHFPDEHLLSVFDGYTYPTDRLVFVCHGAETIYRYVENVVRPYFTKPITKSSAEEIFARKDAYIRKYSQRDNAEWVFVSEWLKQCAEKEHGFTFRHSRVIPNVINEESFPYREKLAEDRKKILIVRKFDNIMVHSLDQSVRAILELSGREFFRELSFEIYGDGDYYDVLTAPLKQFENVHFHRTFVPNDKLSAVHASAGIALLPSRHDAHPVSMGECAASGLAVIGSRVAANPYFMQEDRFHTLADPESPEELADIIERLYREPEEFLRISRGLSEFTRENFGVSQTVDKEVALIKEQLTLGGEDVFRLEEAGEPEDAPVLSVGIFVRDGGERLERCVLSLLNHRNRHKIEVLISDTGEALIPSEIKERIGQVFGRFVRFVTGEGPGGAAAIKTCLEASSGKYFRLMYGEDWIDEENLAELLDILTREEADLIVTKAGGLEFEKGLPEPMADFDMLRVGEAYRFSDMQYTGYGFGEAPLLLTGTVKAGLLRSGSAIAECLAEKDDVDRQWSSLIEEFVETVAYYDLDIYCHLIERKLIKEETEPVEPEELQEASEGFEEISEEAMNMKSVCRRLVRKGVKCVLPYGVVRYIEKRHEEE